METIEQQICELFDITKEHANKLYIPILPSLPDDFGTLLIVGSSGSGKSTILKNQFHYSGVQQTWSSDSICNNFSSTEDAVNRLGAVGLNSIPAWLRPYEKLSTGEKFRADLALNLRSGAIFDEFTSVIDRNVAKSTSVSISKYIKNNNLKNVVFASCHRDIIEWLQPDYIFDTDTGVLTTDKPARPEINIHLEEIFGQEKIKYWNIFAKHHYLDENLNVTARCFIAKWDDVLVGFTSSIAMPNGSIKNAWRGHRTVVLPDFQGMGIGTSISDTIAEIHIQEGKRYFSRTTHFRLGEYREKSPDWRPTSKNKKKRKYTRDTKYNNYTPDTKRICYSHEYIKKDVDE